MIQRAIGDGAWPILLTAFDGDNQLDLAAIGALLDFYRDLEVPGVLALGQASEMLLLDHDERLRVAEFVARHPRGGLGDCHRRQLWRDFGRASRLPAAHSRYGVRMWSWWRSRCCHRRQGLAEQLLELAGLVNPEVRLGIYEIPRAAASPAEPGGGGASGRQRALPLHERHLPPD